MFFVCHRGRRERRGENRLKIFCEPRRHEGHEVFFDRIYGMVGILATEGAESTEIGFLPRIFTNGHEYFGGRRFAGVGRRLPGGSSQLWPLWCEHQPAKSALLSLVLVKKSECRRRVAYPMYFGAVYLGKELRTGLRGV